ncbi:MAG TPA: hypothetical protein PKN86_08845, partial [Candidatus Obscuribacter sp.]|nr:hypothetical protein [Candidatus Obscuribacter sp.]
RLKRFPGLIPLVVPVKSLLALVSGLCLFLSVDVNEKLLHEQQKLQSRIPLAEALNKEALHSVAVPLSLNFGRLPLASLMHLGKV